ncbi:winged helix-turn-helix transcriptional regulator [Tenacibaculum finnmarkense]|nr:winged helix-turn-helix transcriptional regulator [Tenacibaculum finnmarkense]
MNNQFDYIDKQILLKLRSDARKAYSQIAEELNVSNSLIHQRIKKLTTEGVIKNAEFILEENKLGYKTKSYTRYSLARSTFCKRGYESFRKNS